MPLAQLLPLATPSLPAPVDAVTIHADPALPVELQTAHRDVYFANPYTGTLQGPIAPRTRAFFAQVTALHRWFGLANAKHATATLVKGITTIVFLFVLLTGPILWLPKKWTTQSLRTGIVPRFAVQGRARNYNWHKTAGFWLVLPLILMAGTGVIMALPAANALLFRVAHSPLPVRNREGGDARRGNDGQRKPARAGQQVDPRLDEAFTAATEGVTGWQTATLRLTPPSPGPLNITVDRGDGGRPDRREQVAINPKTLRVAHREPFSGMSRGQQWRAWVRFTHTGEAGGWWGETIALVTALGAIALSLTGVALSLDRWKRSRQAKASPLRREVAAAR